MPTGDQTPNTVDSNGVTPWHMAAVSGCTEATDTLLKASAYTTARLDGYTLLHSSVLCNREYGVDPILNTPFASGKLARVYREWS